MARRKYTRNRIPYQFHIERSAKANQFSEAVFRTTAHGEELK